MVELREYQQIFLNNICNSLRSNKRILAVAPCGAGKSYVFAKMVEMTDGGEVLILTHRQELKRQHKELLQGLGLKNWRVAMVMTEANRLNGNPRLIIADEAHLSRANSWVKVIEAYDCKTVGFTATPIRLSGKPLGDIYTDIIDSVSVKWLIENHYLAPYEYYAPLTVDTDNIRSQMGDYVVKELENLMLERAIYSDVIKSYKKLANGEKTIAYCVSVKHAQKVAESFNKEGIKAAWICGSTPEKERTEIMKRFRDGDITVLCNVGIISEGVSINDVTCCLMLRPTESIALGVQQMMRCMRYLQGKKAKIIDCVGNYLRIGLPDEERVWSLTETIKKKPLTDSTGNLSIRVCQNCFMTFKTADVCPYCNTEYKLSERELKAHKDIELQLIKQEEMEKLQAAKKKARMEAGMARTYGELVQIGKQRGYKNPAAWAAMVMKGRKR